MLITHTLLVFYTPRHNPNYAANDSVWKAQNKYIPARKVKKDKLQMNQNSNSQGNLVVLLIPYFFSTKKSDVCPARIQPSLKKTFKRCGVITLGYFAQCKANSIPPPPPRTDGFSALVCYPNTYSVSSSECQKTLHRLFTVF